MPVQSSNYPGRISEGVDICAWISGFFSSGYLVREAAYLLVSLPALDLGRCEVRTSVLSVDISMELTLRYLVTRTF